MFDIIETDLTPSSGKPTGVTPDRDAKARAMAVEMGMKWQCRRVSAWVNITECVTRYATAKHAGPDVHCPCLECSSVVAHIRKNGGTVEPITKTKPQEPS